MTVGILFLLISKVTEEGFGYGDSLAILILGIYLGFWGLIGVLSGAFLLLVMAVSSDAMYEKDEQEKYTSFLPVSNNRILD